MNARATVPKKRVCIYRLLVDLTKEDAQIGDPIEDEVPESRATRLVGDSRRFMIVSFARKSREDYIRRWLENLIMPKMSTQKHYSAELFRFFFLGYTENHLKSGNLLFFREGPDFTVDDLKDHFGGDLRSVYEIYGYGKYAARLGLSFSSTAATKEVRTDTLELLDDLEAADGSLTSDGCGMIRESYAQEIASILQVPPDTAVYQVRLGGIKGVLALCPDEKFDLLCSPGKKIAYRRSMVKYNEGPHVLEVQNISKSPKRGRLNKQFIVLLLTLGVPLSVFEDLLNIQLEQIASIVTNREKALACVDGDVDAEGNGFYQELYEMLLAGHDMSEPYLACLLRRFQRTTLNALREKLQIPVDGSGNIYGVVDCHEVLEEGEVYINLPGRGGPQVGPVVVTRNPAYDPNGIRVLDAVNRPELKHLTNCIVFSAKGAHSEPDRMAGGDLDGDLYFFVFNPALIPKRQATAAPVTVKKLTLRTKTVKIAGRVQGTSRRVPRGDMNKDAIDTFLGLRCNFLLGGLANEWMARVGTTPDLANSAACKTLLPMIEIALDIVKSGESVKKLRYEFEQFKAANPGPRPKRGWTDPLVHLARLVPASPKEEMTFTCDPQLILRDEAPDDFDKMADDAKQAMRAFNRLLQSAISADAEAKDEKRADLVKATMIAQHFPRTSFIRSTRRECPARCKEELTQGFRVVCLFAVSLSSSSAYFRYFTGYKYKKQAFAWLGARWLNYLKSCR
ncbi:RdRP-domain-containing protein [Mycena rebaudengoi]|nr:RdRP-domain-containing protein [Mycena rebaudengoi]